MSLFTGTPPQAPYTRQADGHANLLDKERDSKRERVRALILALVVVAAVSSVVLLANDAHAIPVALQWARIVSAAPLFAAGVAFVVFQMTRRDRRRDLAKNLMLAVAFLLWGAVQLMEMTALAKALGDVVIVLYVADLFWTMLAA